MASLHILRVALVSVLFFAFVDGNHCFVPRVRREWRSISSDERASWIEAVKVFFLLVGVLSALANLLHPPVSYEPTTRSQDCPHHRPQAFEDHTPNPEQLLL